MGIRLSCFFSCQMSNGPPFTNYLMAKTSFNKRKQKKTLSHSFIHAKNHENLINLN